MILVSNTLVQGQHDFYKRVGIVLPEDDSKNNIPLSVSKFLNDIGASSANEVFLFYFGELLCATNINNHSYDSTAPSSTNDPYRIYDNDFTRGLVPKEEFNDNKLFKADDWEFADGGTDATIGVFVDAEKWFEIANFLEDNEILIYRFEESNPEDELAG